MIARKARWREADLVARLLETRQISPEVRHFVFEVPEVETFAFIPGQFVSLSREFSGKKITRAYSIASAPRGNQFEIGLNLMEDGFFSPFLFQMSPGGTVETSAPLGYFVLKQPRREAIFVAAGTGITPFRSILEALPNEPEPYPVTLLFGVRHQTTLLYRSEFEALAQHHSHFRFWPTLSRPEPDWTGRTGYVQTHLVEAIGDRRDLDVYICGLKLMVDDVRAKLKALGFDRKQIVYEKYD